MQLTKKLQFPVAWWVEDFLTEPEALTKWYIANFIFHPKFTFLWGCLQMKTTEVDGNKLNGYETQEEQPQCHGMESIRMWDAQGELGYLSIMQIATVHIWFRKWVSLEFCTFRMS